MAVRKLVRPFTMPLSQARTNSYSEQRQVIPSPPVHPITVPVPSLATLLAVAFHRLSFCEMATLALPDRHMAWQFYNPKI